MHRDDLYAVHQREGVVVAVEGLHDEDFVTRVAGCLEYHCESFASCHGDQEVVHAELKAYGLVVFLDYRPSEGVGSRRIGVGQMVELESRHGFRRARGRLDVRRTDIEVIDLDAIGFALVGIRGEHPDGGFRHYLCCVRNFRHNRSKYSVFPVYL